MQSPLIFVASIVVVAELYYMVAGLMVVAEAVADMVVVAEVVAGTLGVAGLVIVARVVVSMAALIVVVLVVGVRDSIAVITSPLNNIKSVCSFKVIFCLLLPIFLLR